LQFPWDSAGLALAIHRHILRRHANKPVLSYGILHYEKRHGHCQAIVVNEFDDARPMDNEPYYSEVLADDPDLGPLIEAFASDLQACCADLENALARNDVATIVTLAHRYKGSGGGHGFPAVSKSGEELETVAKNQDAVTEVVKQAAERFLDVARRVRTGRPT
jgi:HPt (histidine-containing phosphotransfer) domain-containing protein